MRRKIKPVVLRLLTDHLRHIYKIIREICYGCIRAEQDIEEKLCTMLHHESFSHCKPLLPKRWDSLFDNEAGSDVVFLVGIEPHTWRFPGHRSILQNNPVFRAMLDRPFINAESKITIEDVEGRAFDHLMRYLYHEGVQFQSVDTALATLYAANKYLCPELVNICIRYLDDRISTDTVLHIYQHLRYYSMDLNSDAENNSSGQCSALQHDFLCNYKSSWKDSEKCGETMAQCCTSLLYNCYHFIDQNADQVLIEESVEDLTKDALYDLAKRDTLGISSESILFNAVEKWCNRECKRCQMELSAANRKSILGDRLLFSVRYLLMTSEEFLSGPMQSGLLDQIECALLLGHILRHPINEISSHLTPRAFNYLKRTRCNKSYLPIPLSLRSKHIKVTTEFKTIISAKLGLKKKKSKKDKADSHGRCFNYTLHVLASVFD